MPPRTKTTIAFANHYHGFEHMSWAQKFAKHKEFVLRNAQEQGSEDDDSGDCPLKALMGGYWLIRGDSLGPDPRLVVKLRGNAYKAEGYFDWDGLEGVMQFSRDIEKLPHDLDGSDTEDEAEEESENPLEADVDELKAQVASLTEKLEAVTNAIRVSNDMKDLKKAISAISRKRKSPSQRTSQNKRQKTGPEKKGRHPLRLYFLWRGRETGEGEIQVDNDRSQRGYIDFESRDGLVFHGVFQGSFLGKDVKFDGYKISNSSPPPNVGLGRRWEDLSEHAHEEERVARWR